MINEAVVWHMNPYLKILQIFSKNNNMLSFLQCMFDEYDQMQRQSLSLKKFNRLPIITMKQRRI